MCIAMNGDKVAPGQLAVSTSNRNFEGRQGPGARTVLASPATAAACAVAGVIADPRELAVLEEQAAQRVAPLPRRGRGRGRGSGLATLLGIPPLGRD